MQQNDRSLVNGWACRNPRSIWTTDSVVTSSAGRPVSALADAAPVPAAPLLYI